MKALALDLGGSGGKIFLGAFDCGKIHLKEIHRFINEPIQADGHLTWDIHAIYSSLVDGLQKSAKEGFSSFGVDSFSNDYGLLDNAGKLITNIYMYRDKRTIGILDEIDRSFDPNDLYRITGCQRARFNTLPQIVAQMNGYDRVAVESASILLFVPDLLNLFLCGEKSTEFTIASVSQLYNRLQNRWDDRIIGSFHIPKRILPEVNPPSVILASSKSDILHKTGCRKFSVCTVGQHDTSSAVAAVPTTDKNFVFISSGTWCLMGTETKEMITTNIAFHYNFANEGGVGGKNRFLKNIMGLWLIQECQRSFREMGESITYEKMDHAATLITPFRSIINPDDPVFFETGGMIEKIQEKCRQTQQPIPETPGEINRCIKESLALVYRRTLGQIEEITGRSYPQIHIIGGGAKSGLLNQLAASSMARSVLAGPIEAAAIGNLCAQFIAGGEVRDWAEARMIVQNSFPLKEYLPSQDPGWDEAYDRFLKQING
jgi:sugar (pentulose or hexulose) kinase